MDISEDNRPDFGPFTPDMLDEHVVIARTAPGPDGNSGVVLIYDHADDGVGTALCHLEVEMATGADLILDDEVTGLGSPIVIHGGIRGGTFMSEIDKVLALVPHEALDNANPGLPGPWSPLDARWDFVMNESYRMNRLNGRWLWCLLSDCVNPDPNHFTLGHHEEIA